MPREYMAVGTLHGRPYPGLGVAGLRRARATPGQRANSDANA